MFAGALTSTILLAVWCIYTAKKYINMKAQEQLLHNLMERAGVKKSRKRGRDMVYTAAFDTSKCKQNSKTRHVSSDTDSTSSEVNITKPVVKS